ncbi:MAG: zinc ABC transporter substrate-binding protein [Treponema sp.]|nr:zinc ABC transporter substrate-binding protein [Treponema sp.]
MKSKKIIALNLLMICLSMTVFAKTKIVTTIFPEYDWVRNITGEKNPDVEITFLMNNGVELHSFQPSVKDIAKIGDSDIFIYVGGESDEWVDDVLKTARNKNLVAVNLMQLLGDALREEEVVEGMEVAHHDGEHHHEGHHHGHDGEHDHEDCDECDDDDDEIEYDEHIWLSLRNAKIVCIEIAKVLGEKDAKNKALYTSNCKAYCEKLDALDKEFAGAVQNSKRKTVLFADRFPFVYLVKDYGLDYFAAFSGCSAETEASFKTVAFLASKVKELELPYVLQIENNNSKMANTVIKTSKCKDVKVMTVNSMQSTTAREIKEGQNYLDIMKANLEIIKKAIN